MLSLSSFSFCKTLKTAMFSLHLSLRTNGSLLSLDKNLGSLSVQLGQPGRGT